MEPAAGLVATPPAGTPARACGSGGCWRLRATATPVAATIRTPAETATTMTFKRFLGTFGRGTANRASAGRGCRRESCRSSRRSLDCRSELPACGITLPVPTSRSAGTRASGRIVFQPPGRRVCPDARNSCATGHALSRDLSPLPECEHCEYLRQYADKTNTPRYGNYRTVFSFRFQVRRLTNACSAGNADRLSEHSSPPRRLPRTSFRDSGFGCLVWGRARRDVRTRNSARVRNA